jgi:hypothetical protein
MNTYTLILTGTIMPARNASVTHRNQVSRRQEYVNALVWWLDQVRLLNSREETVKRILFVENSGADLISFYDDVQRAGKPFTERLECVSAPSLPIPEGYHYGWGEWKMIAHAMDEVSIGTTHIIKATGRLTFTNVQGLIRRLPSEYQIAVDSRSRNSKERFSPTQLFLAETEFYNTYLRNLYQRMTADDQRNHYIENLVYDTLIQLPADVRDKVVMRWPVNCDPVGIEGTTGRSYRRTTKRIASALRGTARVVAPQFWF